MSSQNIIYVNDNDTVLHTIAIFGLECVIVFGFLVCLGCFCVCLNFKTPKLLNANSKFKITKYENTNLNDKNFFKLNIPSFTNLANVTDKQTRKLSVDNVHNNNLMRQKNNNNYNDDNNKIDNSSTIVQHVMSNDSISTHSDDNISVAITETHNLNNLEHQSSLITNVKNNKSNNVDINKNKNTYFKSICNKISCGYLYNKKYDNTNNDISEDIENKKKRYLLYKFNNLDESSNDDFKYLKSDPFVDLKDFVKIVYDTYEPSEVEILLNISSPGGYAYKFEEIYSHVNRLKEKGFIITAIIDNFCASGGYMLASACNKIVASPYSQIGSVGVICTAYNWYELSQKIGITQKTFKSGSDKEGFPTGDPITNEDLERMQNRLEDTLRIFKQMVQKSRNLTDEEITEILTAKIWYGNDALIKKLVDVVSLSLDYYDSLLLDGEIYIITSEPEKKHLFQGLMKYANIPDVIEKFLFEINNKFDMSSKFIVKTQIE